jgi:hypothetical protein
MDDTKKIKSFKDLAKEKELTRYRIFHAEKTLEIKTIEIKNQFEPRRIMMAMVNKLLESFFK